MLLYWYYNNMELKISPQDLEVATAYLATLNISNTATELSLEEQYVSQIINKKDIRRFIDEQIAQQAGIHRNDLQTLLGKIISQKIEEAEESGVLSNKDLLDVILLAHKINLDTRKLDIEETKSYQNNTQINNYNTGYEKLLNELLKK